ncbi:hypothetical protein OHA21_43905 [Actinoplanes sp. NBC_00393]|uniref:hypothetical protein n=1 Tax=Actinoplanes sp. NBC_00393 TaxID=2975953 RepID=UPI002E2501A3
MDDLQARIAGRLREALDRQYAGEFCAVTSSSGLIDLDQEVPGEEPCVRLSIDDVARIAAAEARATS